MAAKYHKPSWQATWSGVYVSVDLEEDPDSGNVLFHQSDLNLVVDPLIDALEKKPYFFAKYAFLIKSMESIELIAVVLFKTLLDKPQYYKNSKMMWTPEKVKAEFGEDVVHLQAMIVASIRALFSSVGGLCGYVRRFIQDELIPKAYFDSESLFITLQLIVDEEIGLLV